jgi:acyl-CoA hydrolase
MMVALDENDRPVKVPRLILQTEDEELAWDHAVKRQTIRRRRKETALDGI